MLALLRKGRTKIPKRNHFPKQLKKRKHFLKKKKIQYSEIIEFSVFLLMAEKIDFVM